MPKPTVPKFKPPKAQSKYDPKANPPPVKGAGSPKIKPYWTNVLDKMAAQKIAFEGIGTGMGKSQVAYEIAKKQLSVMAGDDPYAEEQLKQAIKAGMFSAFYSGGFFSSEHVGVSVGVDPAVHDSIDMTLLPQYPRLYAIYVFELGEPRPAEPSGYVVAETPGKALGIWDTYRPEDVALEIDIKKVPFNWKDDSPTHRLVKSGLYGVLIPADDEKSYPRLIEVDPS